VIPDLPSTGDPIADMRAAFAYVKAQSSAVNSIEIHPVIYRKIVGGLARGIRGAKRTLRRRLPAAHRPTFARICAAKLRAAEYLAAVRESPRTALEP